MTADEATDAMPGNPREELRLELGEARKALHAVRAGGLDALVVDAGRGEELFSGAARVMKELRLELDEARETLHTIRTGGFDALVIDAGRGEEVFALGGTGRPYRLLVGARADGGAGYFRAVALDFDGTLADGQVAPATLAALTEARARGVRVILVTGRIMSELRAVFPEVDEHVDAVVAENGALLVTHGGVRLLAAPVGRAVSAALTGRGVAHRSGQVLIAGAAADEPAALEVVRELGLDCQLIRNRGELMILPAGVTKGTGLLEALGELGLSPHNAIGVGDAENDHSLLDACEVGVAVANAVDALRAHADMTLALPDGQGVADLLLGPLLAGRVHLYPRRWQVTLGTDDDGEPVTLPGSQLNIAVCGGTGKGKSYLAGLICEQLIRLGYSLVVFDPEGDHHGLGELRDVIITGGHEGRLADPGEVVRLLRRGRTSVVTDLSHLGRRGPRCLRDGPRQRSRSPPGRHRGAAVGGRRRSPRAHRAGRDRAPHARPRRQGLPARHLAARGAVGRRPARPRRRHHPRLRPARKPVRRPHRGGGRYAPRRDRPPSHRAGRPRGAGLAAAPRPGGGVHPRAPDHTPSAPRA